MVVKVHSCDEIVLASLSMLISLTMSKKKGPILVVRFMFFPFTLPVEKSKVYQIWISFALFSAIFFFIFYFWLLGTEYS